MQLTIKIIFIISVISGLLFFNSASVDQIPQEFISIFKTGNSKKLSAYLNQNVELAIFENINIYSKSQAQQILGKFFNDNPPESFVILSDGLKKDSRSIIGTLKTKNATFRVYILLKKADDQKEYIHQLKIEKKQ